MNSKYNWLKVVFFVFFFLSIPSFGIITGIEPIVGYERDQKLVPTAHTKDRFVYGARITAGILWIAAEAEYLRAQDSETFPSAGLTTKDTADKVKLGLRGTIRLFSIVSAFLRGGAQASRSKHEETSSGTTTVSYTPVKYYPYLGAGLRARLGRNFAFTADVTTVFHNFPNMNNNEYQTTAGFVVSFP